MVAAARVGNRRGMSISYAPHRFPSDVIRHAAWLYPRFTLSYREDEDLLAERGLEPYLATRPHWATEDGLHWVLDMAFDEDRARSRKDPAPANLATLRKLALNLLPAPGPISRSAENDHAPDSPMASFVPSSGKCDSACAQ